jgi:DNA-binding transcriptional ArsR family regulator
MTNLTEIQQRILKVLRESVKPLGPTEIADNLGLSKETERSKVYYNLKKLKNEGLVICSEKGKYSVSKEDLEIIRELQNEILDLLAVKEYYPKELEKELGQDESKIIGAIGTLEFDGLIKEGNISLKKRGYIPKKGFTVYVTDYCRNSTYTPTYLGYSKLGMCPICKEKFSSHDKIITVLFTQKDFIDPIEPKPWISTQVHSKCSPKSKASENVYGKYDPSMFCHYCGLPLTPKMLLEHSISYKLLEDHFFGFELKSIKLLEELFESWLVPFDYPFAKEKHAVQPTNSTIKEVYNKLNLDMPEWMNERLQNDENNLEMNPYDKICHEIYHNMLFTFDGDLSKLKITENFITLLNKYQSFYPENYDDNYRIKEIWNAAQAIKKSYDKNIQKSYAKLLGPEADVYYHIDWAFDSNDYDFDKTRLGSRYENMPSTLAQTFTVKCGNRYYHPYCADKLGLNDNHCNDNNSKGGEGVE